jgi:hypothetical protein
MKDFGVFALVVCILLGCVYLGIKVWSRQPKNPTTYNWEVFDTSHGELMRLRVWGGWLVTHQNSLTFVGPLQNADGWVIDQK